MDAGLKIAVTGGSGRIGSALIKHLLERGHQPINLDVRQAEEPAAPFVYCEAGRRELLQPALVGMDAVIHLGEIPGDWLPVAPNEIFSRNTAAGSCVFQTAADLRIPRVIYASSCQIYGVTGMPPAVPHSLPLDESHPIQPTNVYSLSKAANETYARFVAQRAQGRISITAFRLPMVYFPWFEKHMFDRLEQDRPIKELGLYVGWPDAMRAFELALQQPPAGFEAYNLSAADVMTLQPIRQRLAKDHPTYPPLPTDWPANASPLLTHKAREHFGWQPAFSAMEIYRERRQRKDEAA
jgi:nucleoside-diphosphate-sugar epimerase